jgi:hypothetical protein
MAGMGVDAADVQPDGRLDLYVTNFAREINDLYLGQDNGRFVESARAWGLGSTFLPLGFGMLFGDFDLDGRADIVTANGHVDSEIDLASGTAGLTYLQRPTLYRNAGGRFEEAGALGGPWFAEAHAGRGLAASDFDNDGDLDLAFMTLDRSLFLLRNENPRRHSSVVLRLRGRKSNRDGYGARLEIDRAGDGKIEAMLYHASRSYCSSTDPRAVIGLGEARTLPRLTVRWPSGKTQVVERLPASPETRVIEEPD